jgi:ABC-type transport system involved in multi-copper enzyme maturation permease subunit
MEEYNKINLKTPFAMIMCVLIVGLTAFMFWIYFKSEYKTFFIVGLVLVTFILFGLYYSLTAKVILTEKEIITKTLFGIRKLNYSDIKTIGVYAASNYVSVFEKERYHKLLFFAQKFIYLSGQTDFNPYFLKRPKDYIDFHYRTEIYEIIERKIKAST